MTKPPPTVSAHFVANFLNGIKIDAAARERLMHEAGIPPSGLATPGTRITEAQFATLYRLLVAHLDDEMPGMFSRRLRRGATKLLCLSLLDAPSLQVALSRYVRFHRVVLDDFVFELGHGPELTRLAIVPSPAAPPSILAQQLILKFVHSLASWLAGRNVPVVRLQFAFPPPPDIYESAYLYPGPAFFAQHETALHLPSSALDTPLAPRTKEDVREFIARAPSGWLFAPSRDASAGRQVRDYLEKHMHRPNDIESVAAALRYSVRTLCRRLEAEGTSFRVVKDEWRRDLAVQRLTQTSASIAAIAFELGFRDTTAFHRAFKHWTGSTPGVYRRRTGEEEPFVPIGETADISYVGA